MSNPSIKKKEEKNRLICLRLFQNCNLILLIDKHTSTKYKHVDEFKEMIFPMGGIGSRLYIYAACCYDYVN